MAAADVELTMVKVDGQANPNKMMNRNKNAYSADGSRVPYKIQTERGGWTAADSGMWANLAASAGDLRIDYHASEPHFQH